MAVALPRFMVIKLYYANSAMGDYWAPSMMKPRPYRDYVCSGEKNVFSPYAKIEVERAKINNKFVHLRFCYSNKYWAIREGADDQKIKWIVASSDQPVEDTSKLSYTMFEPTLFGTDETYGWVVYFRHVQSGQLVRPQIAELDKEIVVPLELENCLGVFGEVDQNLFAILPCLFGYVDWDTIVIMPKHVAFKGYNNKYLRSAWFQSHEYLDFSPNDCGKETTAYEVTMIPEGHLRLKSKFFGKYWRSSPNWIWGDSSDDVSDDDDTLFWPVKVNDNTIALCSKGNNRFCSSLTTEGKTDCRNAAVPTITTEARLKVEEPVLEREITDVIYRMDHARIFNEMTFVIGTSSATNNTEVPAPATIRVPYRDTSSYTFSNSMSIRTGVKTSIKTGFARIVEGIFKSLLR